MAALFSPSTFGALLSIIKDTLAGAGVIKGDKGDPGSPGREVELDANSTHIIWRLTGDTAWKELIALSLLIGPKGNDGDDGNDGDNGETPQFRMNGSTLQLRFPSDEPDIWTDLYTFGGDGGSGSSDWSDIANKPSEFPPEAHIHELSDITNIPEVLPQIAHIQFDGKTDALVPINQLRQDMRGNTYGYQGESCSIRPIAIYLDKPVGANQFIQPFIYNRLAIKSNESSNIPVNQSLFRGGHSHIKDKGWAQVNIAKNVQIANGDGTITQKTPVSMDGVGNQFFADGVIKLAEGITHLVIPTEYQMKYLIFHTKSLSKRNIKGGFLTPDYSASEWVQEIDEVRTFTYTADFTGICSFILMVNSTDPQEQQVTIFMNGKVFRNLQAPMFERTPTEVIVVPGDVLKISCGTEAQIVMSHFYKVPYRRTQSEKLSSHFRSNRLLEDIRPTKNKWISHKSWIKFAVSEYVPPQGKIGESGYVRGKYKKGILSGLTLTSDRYVNPGSRIIWTTSIIER